MPVGIVCPACNTPLTFHKPPVAVCPRCQAQFPQALQQSAEASLSQQSTQRPLLLTLSLYCSPGFGVLTLVGLLGAVTGRGDFSINGESVSGAEFLRQAGPLFALSGLICIGVGVGLHLGRSWVRWLMLSYWIVAIAGAAGLGWSQDGLSGAAANSASLLIPLGLAYWYLFQKPNVVEYFRALDLAQAAGVLEQYDRGA